MRYQFVIRKHLQAGRNTLSEIVKTMKGVLCHSRDDKDNKLKSAGLFP